jgi:hypothetical protein
MRNEVQIVPAELEDGTIVRVEAVRLSREEDVSIKSIQFTEVAEIIQKVAVAVVAPLEKVSPQKITIELGVTLGVESGGLCALITKGTLEGNFKITLEWERPKVTTER